MPPRLFVRRSTKPRQSSPALACGCASPRVSPHVSGWLSPARHPSRTRSRPLIDPEPDIIEICYVRRSEPTLSGLAFSPCGYSILFYTPSRFEALALTPPRGMVVSADSQLLPQCWRGWQGLPPLHWRSAFRRL